ncbi:hypothetical protein ABZS79_31945 [Streptomyces griseoloalbus]
MLVDGAQRTSWRALGDRLRSALIAPSRAR